MRISATTLESFRLFLQPDQEWMTEGDLAATIRGEFVPTPAVSLGRAFGSVLEQPDRYRVKGGFVCGEYTFSDETMREPLALLDRRGVFEAKAVKAYGPHDVVSKADQLIGAQLKEFKTTATFDFEKYATSCQWRFMVDAFEPVLVTYHVFVVDDHGNGVVEVRDIHTFNLFPYPELHQDCARLVDQFTEYVTAMGLADVLNARQRDAA